MGERLELTTSSVERARGSGFFFLLLKKKDFFFGGTKVEAALELSETTESLAAAVEDILREAVMAAVDFSLFFREDGEDEGAVM